MKKILSVIFVAITLVCLLVGIRTLLHVPAEHQYESSKSSASIRKVDANVIANHLSKAIRFPTISNQDSNLFKADVFEEFIQWVLLTYPNMAEQMQVKRLGTYSLLFKWQGSQKNLKPILLTAHYDVVPVIPGSENLWEHPPFAGIIANDIIWGRGALDDKSAVISMLEAGEMLLTDGFKPERTVYFSFGHDEELGGPKGAASVTNHLKNQGVQLLWSLDEGSFVTQNIMAGISEPVATINVAEKGSVTLQIVAKAAGGHSSMPPRNHAIGVLAEAITKLQDNPVPGGLEGLSAEMLDQLSRHMPFTERMIFANLWLFGGLLESTLSESQITNAMLRTTTAPTMLSGSVKVNVLPIEAIATVNFRLHPRDSIEDLEKYVSRLVAHQQIEVRRPGNNGIAASEVSDWHSEGFQTIAHSLRMVYGDIAVAPGLMVAGSDSRHYAEVADNAFRFNPMLVGPSDLAGFHGTNEKISIENLVKATQVYALIIENSN